MTEICQYCRRPVQGDHVVDPPTTTHFAAVYATVNHIGYGCDTGCCGYMFETYDKRDRRLHSKFEFSHPYWELENPSDPNNLGYTREQFQKDWARDEVLSLFGKVPINWTRSEMVDKCDSY